MSRTATRRVCLMILQILGLADLSIAAGQVGVIRFTSPTAKITVPTVVSTRIPPVSTETWPTGLVACWPLDEASGTRVDTVGGNDLTDNNTVTQAAGTVSNAAQFTAANSESLSRADNAALSTGDADFTFAAWVYLDTTTGDRSIVGKWGSGGSNPEGDYWLYLSGSRFRFLVGDGTTIKEAIANTFGAPSISTWYFVAGWLDAAAHIAYVSVDNGAADSITSAVGTDGTGGLAIGRVGDYNGAFMNGRIDAAMFWKRVLSDEERTSLYNGGAGRACP